MANTVLAKSGATALGDLGRRGRPVAVDLFAGAGGFALGVEQAGFDVVAAVEYDPVHAVAHAFNFPRTNIVCEDVRMLTGNRLRQAVRTGLAAHGRDNEQSRVDVVFGGPPCQGFSAGGKHDRRDRRNLLIFDFCRLVAELEPTYWVLENVPPLKSFPDPDYPGAKLIDRLTDEFRAAGYATQEPRVLNASHYGVPQDRRRVILMGAREGHPLPSFPEPNVQPVPKRSIDDPRPWEHGGARANRDLPKGPSVWDAIGDLPDLEQFDELWAQDEVEISEHVLAELEAGASSYARRLRGLDADPADFAHPRKWTRSLLTSSRRTRHNLKTSNRFVGTPEGHSEPISRFYRLDRNGLSSTLRAGTGYERGSFMAPRPVHPVSARVISVREAARLHSYPDWFRFHYSKWHGFRQIGNSLPPSLARAIGAELLIALGVVPAKPALEVDLGDPATLRLATMDAAATLGADLENAPSNKLRRRDRDVVDDGHEITAAALG